MTRYDKYGNKCQVEKYCCGSCANYVFEDDDDTNKCTHYCRYFYKSDSCRDYWEEASDCGY